jgi:hypothetical protein
MMSMPDAAAGTLVRFSAAAKLRRRDAAATVSAEVSGA